MMAMAGALVACTAQEQTTTVTMPVSVDTETFVEINSVADLQAIEMHKSYRLMQDLDLSGSEWLPLGSFDVPYRGIFDGNGHEIANLTITNRNDSFNGLFAHVQGTVKNLEISDFSIAYVAQFITYAGGLAGYLSGNVENVQANGTITITNNASNTYAGLLVGISVAPVTQMMTAEEFLANRIEQIEVNGDLSITGENFIYAGGLAGKISNSIVENVKVDLDLVAASGSYRIYAGGLTGHHYGGILKGYEEVILDSVLPIKNVYVKGSMDIDIEGIQASVGGFCGFSQYGDYENIVIDLDLNLAGSKIYAGMFLGEAWNGNYKNVLASGAIALTTNPEQIVLVDSLLAFVNEGPEIDDCYYHLNDSTIGENTYGSAASASEVGTSSWYEGWLEWDQSFMSFTDLAAAFSD